ncbi:hypothetical protein OB919_14405 [Halobacteria archaeon AArc-curdl1]|uniref:Uncharacterized protein n=1 Tax=Natronosalvus hydrolyticus TaxID=2979988 RepID=A0AAP2ZC47_9EURY|nr:hypothetical protein [Halobacteria archaeon AArc-curdl1]
MEDLNPMIKSELHSKGRPFHPMDRIILVDEFDESRCGWYGHHITGDEFENDWGVICRSTMPTHWWGSYGSQSGHHSLKLATVPEKSALTRAIKRITMPYHDGQWYTGLRFEMVFAYHEQPRGTTVDTNVRPEKQELTGEHNVRGFSVEFDIHDIENRWWPAVRYFNFSNGNEAEQKWQYHMGGVDPMMDDFADIPDGDQKLCWNSPNDSVPWKPNWHYLRFDIDVEDKSYNELQCNNNVIDMRDLSHTGAPPSNPPDDDRVIYGGDIFGLLNPILSIQTNTDTRSFLFVDSLVLSAEVA